MLDQPGIRYDSQGLVPAIIQDWRTRQVLMVAYMNQEALERTLATKTTWFFSRSRNELWHKGLTSGHIQYVKSACYDCDGDALLIEVEQVGPACHTGAQSCFFNEILPSDRPQPALGLILEELYQVILHRRNNPQEGSYTNYLLDSGIDKVLKKVGEETTEVVIAAKNAGCEELIYETADLLYHLSVLMVVKGVTLEEIAAVLAARRGAAR